MPCRSLLDRLATAVAARRPGQFRRNFAEDEAIGWLILVCGGFGALMPASAFDSQARFYSDSTVLAAQGFGCNLISHAITRLPYTLVAAGVAFVGFVFIA